MKRFSEYIQKVMAEDHDPLGIILNDKIRVREYCESKLGDYVSRELFSHRIYSGYDIDECLHFVKPPCVVKANNAWHKHKFLFDKNDTIDRETLEKWQNHKWQSCEWAYKQMKPGFVIEKLLDLTHVIYRHFVFNGRVEFIRADIYSIVTKKIDVQSVTVYDREWNNQNVRWNNCKMLDIPKPNKLNEMIYLAEGLYSENWKFMRMDFYCIDDIIMVSELQQYHAGGTNGFSGDFDFVLYDKLGVVDHG